MPQIPRGASEALAWMASFVAEPPLGRPAATQVRHDTSVVYRPTVYAHRGSSAEAPEHTLAAYRRAIEQGADGLECDVRLTSDGHVVCVHDGRIDRTSTGRGRVSNQTLEELKGLDFGSWRSVEGFDPPQEERRAVLTLRGLLELVVDAGRPVRIAIETKHPQRYAGFLERRVLQELERVGLARPPRDGSSLVALMSFSEFALRRMRALAPGIPRVFLMERVPVRCRGGFLPYGATIAGPSVSIIRKHPGFVRRLHAAGNGCYVWTVDRSEDVDVCAAAGVDGIITNRPGHVARRLTSSGHR